MALWYYMDGDNRVGPVELPLLQQQVQAGRVRRDDLVWREGMPDWVPAGSVRSLFPPGPGDASDNPYSPPQHASKGGRGQAAGNSGVGVGLAVGGIICGIIALGCCPPLFGFIGVGMSIGAMQNSQSRTLGTVALAISLLGMIAGMAIGAILMVQMQQQNPGGGPFPFAPPPGGFGN